MLFKAGQHIHLVGIGGYGIAPIARVLLERGFVVSGSDMNANALTQALAKDGATVYIGHEASNVNSADMVIITSAVKDDHVEVEAARRQGIPVYKRKDILADLMAGEFVIAIAGTHGKTTTTSMVVHILKECGKDPSYIVGGVMGNTGTNAGVGKGGMFVIEADEYDNMFHGLRPNIAIVTSVEYDHPDFFKTEDEMLASFQHFIDLLGDEGLLIACADDAGAQRLAEQRIAAGKPARLYGMNALVSIQQLQMNAECIQFEWVNTQDETAAKVRLPVPGMHNVLNATAAIAAAVEFSQSDAGCFAAALATFKSSGRRFDLRGEVNGIAVIDDYAHHPTAIKTTLEAARTRYPDRKIWAVWQPHTFSRTETLLEQYAVSFDAADEVIVTDIFASREKPTLESITGAKTAAAIKHPHARHTGTLSETAQYLYENLRAPAVIVIMSAGDAPKIGEDLLNRWMG